MNINSRKYTFAYSSLTFNQAAKSSGDTSGDKLRSRSPVARSASPARYKNRDEKDYDKEYTSNRRTNVYRKSSRR